MTIRSRRVQDDQGKRGQVRRPSLYRHQGQGAARLGSGEGVRRRQVHGRPCVRRLVDRRLEGHRGLRHAAHAGSGFGAHGPVLRRADARAHLRRDRALDGKGYERDPRSHRASAARPISRSTGLGDTAYFGPEPEFFIFDSVEWNVDMSGCYVKINSEEAPWSSDEQVRRRQHGPPPADQGRLLPGAAGRFAAGHPLGDVPRARGEGVEVEVHHHEVAAPGQCEIGTKFNTAGEARRLDADPQVHGAQRRALLRQDRDLHAEARRRRQRLGHARAPVGVEGRQEPLRRRRLRGPVRTSRSTTSAASSSTRRR